MPHAPSFPRAHPHVLHIAAPQYLHYLVHHPPLPAFSPPPLQVKGFNVRNWMRDNKKKIPAMLTSLGKLVGAGKLSVAYTE